MKRNLRRIHLQSGCTDRMRRPIDGLFEVLIDEDQIVEQMERATNNKSRQAWHGPLGIVYHPCTKAQADFIKEHPGDSKIGPPTGWQAE